MSTSLLYHAFGVRGYRYVKTEYVGGKIILSIEQPRESYCCSACGSGNVIGRGQTPRRFRTVPIGIKPVYLALAVPRVECRDCEVVRQVKIAFADPRVTYTKDRRINNCRVLPTRRAGGGRHTECACYIFCDTYRFADP